jgi:hypothetical protein
MEDKKKPGKLIDMYHGIKHHIQISEALVEAHKKCGWRLKK